MSKRTCTVFWGNAWELNSTCHIFHSVKKAEEWVKDRIAGVFPRFARVRISNDLIVFHQKSGPKYEIHIS